MNEFGYQVHRSLCEYLSDGLPHTRECVMRSVHVCQCHTPFPIMIILWGTRFLPLRCMKLLFSVRRPPLLPHLLLQWRVGRTAYSRLVVCAERAMAGQSARRALPHLTIRAISPVSVYRSTCVHSWYRPPASRRFRGNAGLVPGRRSVWSPILMRRCHEHLSTGQGGRISAAFFGLVILSRPLVRSPTVICDV